MVATMKSSSTTSVRIIRPSPWPSPSGRGDPDDEGGAGGGGADLDLAAQAGDGVADEGQAHAALAVRAGPVALGREAAVEDACAQVARNSRARVGDGDADGVVRVRDGDADAALGAALRGVKGVV